jgi:hypothetical protein
MLADTVQYEYVLADSTYEYVLDDTEYELVLTMHNTCWQILDT